MAASIETLTLNSGRYWTPAGEKAEVTFTVQGPAVTNDLGVETREPDQTFLDSVQQALDSWANVADIKFNYVPLSSAFPSDPFAANSADITFTFGYEPDAFYQTDLVSVLNSASPDGGSGPVLTSSRVLVNELLYQDGDLLLGSDSSFVVLANSVGIAMGLAWGRGVEDSSYIDELATYNTDLAQYENVDLPIYTAELAVYNAEFTAYLLAVNAYVISGAAGDPPEPPPEPTEPTQPELPNEPVSAVPSFALESDDDPRTFTRDQARLDNTIMVQQFFSGTNATLNDSAGGRPQGPQIWDIAAAQFIYGANKQFNNGDNIYDFSSGVQYAKTLWDGGGNDTYSISNSAVGGVIDLREGETFVSSNVSTRTWNAFGANIENAWGGSGNDIITGNSLNNLIGGGAGADTIDGGAGIDLIGFSSSDAGVNVNILTGTGTGGHAQGDTYINVDNVLASSFNDTISGNNNNNDLRGDQGNDIITSLAGNDYVNGNRGNDDIDGGDGNDTIRGGKDTDTVTGGANEDFVAGDRGNDVVNGGDGNDFIRGGKDSDTIDGGANNDTIFGDLGNDNITGGSGDDFFVFYTDSGVDVITDFEGVGVAGGDVIRISSSVYSSVDQVLANISGSVLDLGNNGATITISGVTGFTADDIEII